MEWILNPVTLYITVALALLGCLALFISTKMEVHSVRRMAAEARESAASGVRDLSAEMKEIRQEAQHEEPIAVIAPQNAAGLNLTKRAQALRMHRRGESLAGIAAALNAPQSEIQLLLKVHTLLNGQAEATAARETVKV